MITELLSNTIEPDINASAWVFDIETGLSSTSVMSRKPPVDRSLMFVAVSAEILTCVSATPAALKSTLFFVLAIIPKASFIVAASLTTSVRSFIVGLLSAFEVRFVSLATIPVTEPVTVPVVLAMIELMSVTF